MKCETGLLIFVASTSRCLLRLTEIADDPGYPSCTNHTPADVTTRRCRSQCSALQPNDLRIGSWPALCWDMRFIEVNPYVCMLYHRLDAIAQRIRHQARIQDVLSPLQLCEHELVEHQHGDKAVPQLERKSQPPYFGIPDVRRQVDQPFEFRPQSGVVKRTQRSLAQQHLGVAGVVETEALLGRVRLATRFDIGMSARNRFVDHGQHIDVCAVERDRIGSIGVSIGAADRDRCGRKRATQQRCARARISTDPVMPTSSIASCRCRYRRRLPTVTTARPRTATPTATAKRALGLAMLSHTDELWIPPMAG